MKKVARKFGGYKNYLYFCIVLKKITRVLSSVGRAIDS